MFLSLRFPCMGSSINTYLIKFGSFLLLISLTEMELSDKPEEPRRGKFLLSPHTYI